jgi:uncharacterized membrane protein YphA (DoxX/SURF4 family)
MTTDITPAAVSKLALWSGRVISALVALLLTFSAVMKFLEPPDFTEGFAKFGYPESLALPIGIVEVVCMLLYIIPRTSVLGAILLTGYLGGATATHVRISDPFVPPIVFGVLVWLSLYLRDMRLRALIPWRR